jgi:hypothetical protein
VGHPKHPGDPEEHRKLAARHRWQDMAWTRRGCVCDWVTCQDREEFRAGKKVVT